MDAKNCNIKVCDLITISKTIVENYRYGIDCGHVSLCGFTKYYFSVKKKESTEPVILGIVSISTRFQNHICQFIGIGTKITVKFKNYVCNHVNDEPIFKSKFLDYLCNLIAITTTTTTRRIITTIELLFEQYVCELKDKICNCPEGYTATLENCYKEETINPTVPSTPQYLYAKNNIRYGTTGTIVFNEQWNYNGTGNNYNFYSAGSFWRNPMSGDIGGSWNTGIMNLNAVWSGVTLDNQTIGFPVCIDIAVERTYLIGLGCDNVAEIKIDGISVLMQDPTALYDLYVQNGWSIPAPSESTFRLWFIYPIKLSAGKHIIELIGHNTVNVAAVGLDVYNMTELELMACNSYEDMGDRLLFSTKNEVGKLVKIGNEGQGYSCPEGYILGYCDDSPMCYKIDYVECNDSPVTTTTTTIPCTLEANILDDLTGEIIPQTS